MWQENTLLSASFELEAPETFDTIIIINGVGKPEQKINGIKIQTKTSKTNSYWQNLFKEVRVKNDSGAQETDGFLILKKGQEYLQITFNPVQEVLAIMIELMQTTDNNAIINEVLIPRKILNQLQIPIISQVGMRVKRLLGTATARRSIWTRRLKTRTNARLSA